MPMPRLYHPETNAELLTVDPIALPIDQGEQAYPNHALAGYITPSMLWRTFAHEPTASFARSEDYTVISVYVRLPR